MKKWLTAVLVAVMFLCVALPVHGVEDDEPALQTEETPAVSPEITPEVASTPEITPETGTSGLVIVNNRLFEGMDRTYAEGYVPRAADGMAVLVLPLTGETRDEKLSVTLELGTLINSPFVYGNYNKDVTPERDGVYVISFSVPLAKERQNGVYPVTLKVSYTESSGAQKTQTFTMNVTISDGIDPNANISSGREAAEKPELFIEHCLVNPETIAGGESFSVSLTVRNIGNIRARNIKLSFGSELAGITPVSNTNAMLMDNIAAEESGNAVFHLQTSADIFSGDASFYVTLDYVDLYGGSYSTTRTFLFHVTQPAELSYDKPELPKTVNVGDTISVPANVFNTGKSTLRNVTVSLTAPGLNPASSIFLGDIAPGHAGYGNLSVFVGMKSTAGERYGMTTGTWSVTYTDELGVEHTVEEDIRTTIQELVIETAEPVDREVEEKEKNASQWWIAILVGAAVIAILVSSVVTTKVLRSVKMKHRYKL